MTNSTTAAQPLDLDKLEALALARKKCGTSLESLTTLVDFQAAANPDTILALIAQARAARPKREMPPEMKAAIEEARKTGTSGALLPDGSAVFINYGHDYGDNEHLCCTACGGSGHIEDQQARATLAPITSTGVSAPASQVAAQQAAATPIYAAGTLASIDGIADELEAEAMNYEGDFADTVKGCAEALREIAQQAAAKAPAAQADERIAKLRAALKEVSEVQFGYDGDCGTTRIAEDALYADEHAASPASTPEASQQAAAVAAPKQGDAHALMLAAGFTCSYDQLTGVHTYHGYIEDAERVLAAPATAVAAPSQQRNYNWLLRLAESKGYSSVYSALCAAPATAVAATTSEDERHVKECLVLLSRKNVGGSWMRSDAEIVRQALEAMRTTQQEGGK